MSQATDTTSEELTEEQRRGFMEPYQDPDVYGNNQAEEIVPLDVELNDGQLQFQVLEISTAGGYPFVMYREHRLNPGMTERYLEGVLQPKEVYWDGEPLREVRVNAGLLIAAMTGAVDYDGMIHQGGNEMPDGES